MKEILTASVVFSSMVVFDILREQLHMSIWTLSTAVQGKVSLDRINDFLQNVRLSRVVDQALNVNCFADRTP